MREKLRQRLWARLKASWTEMAPRDFGDSVVVFAPHPDDETLGCGGTIMRMVEAGVNVRVVFMTDGSMSHPKLMGREELAALRKGEAEAAVTALGLKAADADYLAFPDADLQTHEPAAVGKVVELLGAASVDSCFVPYHGDHLADHKATNSFVRAAVARLDNKPAVYGYPIWYWFSWPWVPLPIKPTNLTLRSWLNSLRVVDNFKSRPIFDHAVDISDLLERKRVVLSNHRSQMESLMPEQGWGRLGDIAGGAFVDRFFQPYEVFHRYNN